MTSSHKTMCGLDLERIQRAALDRRRLRADAIPTDAEGLRAAIQEIESLVDPEGIDLGRDRAALAGRPNVLAKDLTKSKAQKILEARGRGVVGYQDLDQRTVDILRQFARETDYGTRQIGMFDPLDSGNMSGILISEEAQADYRTIKALIGIDELNQQFAPTPPSTVISATVSPAMPPTTTGATTPASGTRAMYTTPNAPQYQQIINNVGPQPSINDFIQEKFYTRFSRMLKSGGVSDLFQDSIIRNSAYAMVGLAAFGFIYSATKERTQESIEGPPLLPGGSAYETDFPRSMPTLSDLKYLNPTTAAMRYQIHLNGNQRDVEKLQELTGGVVNGPTNTTMYDGLPRLGRDPYQNVASSF